LAPAFFDLGEDVVENCRDGEAISPTISRGFAIHREQNRGGAGKFAKVGSAATTSRLQALLQSLLRCSTCARAES
jgi:hypothetical protein